MNKRPRHGFGVHPIGPLVCLAFLFYGAVSLSKPQHSYLLSFWFTGQIDGAFQASVQLDDGSLIAPVTALRGDGSVHVAVLPTRTIRGIRLITGNGSGIIRNLQILKIAVPIRDLNADRLHDADVYRTIDAVRASEGLRLNTVEKSALEFQTIPGAAHPSLDFDLQGPLSLLHDLQFVWMQRVVVILVMGAAALWLFSRARIPSLAQVSPRIGQFFNGGWAAAMACAFWVVAAFSVYFVYAGRLSGFSWNIIEFIIANHLQDFGRYALGATYPTAVWRPIGPTFIVLTIDALVRDPVFTYQLLSGAAMASFTASIYLLNRVLFSQLLANAGAALAFATPMVSLSLINHAHSISHLSFLLVASPTLLASVICILRIRNGAPSAPRWLWMASIGWIFCYLCRPESMLMAACFFITIFIIARRKLSARLLAPLASFIVVFLGFNVLASTSAARDDLLARKIVYQFYASQGWTELFDAKRRAEMPTDDFERHGYVRAIALYGTPEENSESLTHAIAKNPKAFVERIGNNLRYLIDLLAKGKWLSFDLALLLFMLPLGFVFLERPHRLLVFFGAAVFSVVGIFAIFHIDDRYVTIAVPAAILLGSLSAHGLSRMPMPARFGSSAFVGIVLVIALLHLPAHFAALSSAFERERLDLTAFRLIGEGFRNAVPASSAETAPVMVHLDVPLPPALKAGAVLLLFPYFARTSLLWAESSEPYPRDRLFSLPRCPATHVLARDTAVAGYGEKLGTYFVSQVGDLAVFRLAAPDRSIEDAFAARFCAARSGG
jgi:hypothetical protein